MNIFILSDDPVEAARQQCDKHIVKMPVESAQMLSTVHRMIDGSETRKPSKSGKTMIKYWELDDSRENVLYKAVHYNHPCTVWSRESVANYLWHFEHFRALLNEFSRRFGKTHKSEMLLDALSMPPVNLRGDKMTAYKLAMNSAPWCIDPSDPIGSYRKFYITKRSRFEMKWEKGTPAPDWFLSA